MTSQQENLKTVPGFLSLRVLFAMIMREMNTRYGRTWGGYVWAVIDPVGMIALLSLAFSQFIHLPPLGNSFPLFYATGYVPFHFYMETSSNTSSAVTFNKSLMHFPAVTPLDAVIARFILSILTLVVVMVFVFVGISVLTESSGSFDFGQILLAVSLAALLGLGIGTLNCVLFSFFPVWQRVWTVINRPLFLISGVFFTFESMPAAIQSILWFNPLIHVVGIMRKGFYASYDGAYISHLYVLGLGFGALVIGTALLIRHKSYVIEN